MNTHRNYVRQIAEGSSLERVVFFSDAVFAIAMTLLIVELHVPTVPGDELGPALLELVPGYFTFILSFAVIGLVWLSHHRKFRVIVRYTPALLRLNLLVLLFVASLPLPTAILGEYGDTTLAVYVYAATICAIGLLMSAIWIYAWHAGLVDPQVSVGVFRYVLVQSFVIPGIFLLSIPLAALAGPFVAEVSWVLAVPISFIITRIYSVRSNRQTSEGSSP